MTEEIPAITTVLSIGGQQLTPSELTSVIGIEPTKIWTQQHEGIKLAHPQMNLIEWRYRLERQRKWSLGEAIDEIMNIVWTNKEQIRTFLSENKLTMHIDCRPFGDASVLEYIIQPEVMRKMAFFAISLSLAVYKGELQGQGEGEKRHQEPCAER